jgi:hypothetical protein
MEAAMRRLGPTDDRTEELWARFVVLSEKSLLTQIREMLWECHIQVHGASEEGEDPRELEAALGNPNGPWATGMEEPDETSRF